MNLESVMWEPDTVAPPAEWQALAERRKEHTAEWMLREGEPATENRERLQRLGVESVVFAPCGNRPDAGDFFSVMAGNLTNLAHVFAQE